MDKELKQQFFSALAASKKIESAFSTECEIQMNELAILRMITGKCCQCPSINLDVPDIQDKLQISKPAVSYILNSLEKKSYITREIDPKDRRKISISATPTGIAVEEHSTQICDQMWNRIVSEFGETNIQHLTDLLENMNECVEKIFHKA